MSRTVAAADVVAITGMAGDLAAVNHLDDLRRRTVELLPGLVPSTLVAWNEVDGTGRIEAALSHGLPPGLYEELGEAFSAHVGDHPVIAHFQRSGDGRPYAISEFLTEEEFHATGLYQAFYRPLGAEDQLSFILPDPDLIVGIALNRDRRGFSARDRAVSNLIRPLLIQAYRSVTTLTRARRMMDAAEEVLAGRDEAVVVLDRLGRVEYSSRLAEELLFHFFGPSPASGLPGAVVEWLARSRSPHGRLWPLVVEREGRTLAVRRAEAGGSTMLVLRAGGARDQSMAGRFGLTSREAEVLALVAEGLPTKAIAARLGISTRTVDTHVWHACDKLGVRTRLQAVALLRDPAGPAAQVDESAP